MYPTFYDIDRASEEIGEDKDILVCIKVHKTVIALTTPYGFVIKSQQHIEPQQNRGLGWVSNLLLGCFNRYYNLKTALMSIVLLYVQLHFL